MNLLAPFITVTIAIIESNSAVDVTFRSCLHKKDNEIVCLGIHKQIHALYQGFSSRLPKMPQRPNET